MNLQIVTIADRGIANQERLHLKVLASTNLVYYVVFDTKKLSAGKIRTIPDRAFWFSDHPVFAGDNILLYTCGGLPSVVAKPEGGFNRFFYWGLSNTIWQDLNQTAVLLELVNWQTSI